MPSFPATCTKSMQLDLILLSHVQNLSISQHGNPAVSLGHVLPFELLQDNFFCLVSNWSFPSPLILALHTLFSVPSDLVVADSQTFSLPG